MNAAEDLVERVACLTDLAIKKQVEDSRAESNVFADLANTTRAIVLEYKHGWPSKVKLLAALHRSRLRCVTPLDVQIMLNGQSYKSTRSLFTYYSCARFPFMDPGIEENQYHQDDISIAKAIDLVEERVATIMNVQALTPLERMQCGTVSHTVSRRRNRSGTQTAKSMRETSQDTTTAELGETSQIRQAPLRQAPQRIMLTEVEIERG